MADDNVGRASVSIVPNLDRFSERLRDGLKSSIFSGSSLVREQMKYSMGNAIATGGATILAATGIAAFGEAARGIIDLGIEYQRSLSVFQSVTRATGAEMGRARAQAIALGNDLHLPGVSAAGAADAMTELAKAGLTTQQSIDAAKGSLALSIAAQTSEGQAAEITANALLTFGLQANKATMVTDLLAGAANASSASMTDMAYALTSGGSTAHSAKVPIQDMIASLTVLANSGIKGADGGTLFRTALTRLMSPTHTASDMMKQLGLRIYDSHGKFVGMRTVIEELQKSLNKLSPAQKANATNVIFGSRAARFANIMASQGVKEYDAMYKQVTRSGQAAQLAAAQNVGLGGALDNLQSTLQTVALQAFEKIQPSLTKFVKWLTDVGAKLPGAAAAVGAFFQRVANSGPVQAVLHVLGQAFTWLAAHWKQGAAIAVGLFLTFSSRVRALFATVGENIAKVMPYIKRLWTAFREAGPSLLATARNLFNLGKGIASDLTPVIKTVAVLVGGAFLLAIKGVSAALPPVSRAVAAITGWLNRHRVAVTAVLIALSPLLLAFAQTRLIVMYMTTYMKAYAAVMKVVAAAQKIWNAVQAAWNVIADANPLTIIIIAVIALVAAIIYAYKHSEKFRNIVDGIGRAIRDGFGKALNWVKGVISNVVNWFKRFHDVILAFMGPLGWIILAFEHWGQIKAVVSRIFNSVITFLTTWGKKLLGWGAQVILWVTTPWRYMAAIVIGLLMMLWNFISPWLQKVGAFFTERWNTLVHNVTAVWNWIVNVARTAFTWVANIVTTTTNRVHNTVTGIWNRIWGFIHPLIMRVYMWIYVRFMLIQITVHRYLQGVHDVVMNIWNRVWTFLSGIVERIWKRISTGFERIVTTITGAQKRGTDAVNGFLSHIWDAISGFVKKMWDVGVNLVKGLIDGIKSMGSAIAGFITKFIDDHVPGPVRKLLHIHSPSRLFHDIGQQIGNGLVGGIKASHRPVLGAVNDMTNAVIDGFAPVNGVADNLFAGQQAAAATARRTAAYRPGLNGGVTANHHFDQRIFIDRMEAKDVADFEREADRRRRLAALTPGRA